MAVRTSDGNFIFRPSFVSVRNDSAVSRPDNFYFAGTLHMSTHCHRSAITTSLLYNIILYTVYSIRSRAFFGIAFYFRFFLTYRFRHLLLIIIQKTWQRMLMICPWASVRGGPRFTSYIAYYNMSDDPKIEKKKSKL